MVFIFFGASPDSWAVGNDKFSACNNLPITLQNAWDRLAQVQEEPSLAGTIINWLSATPDGTSYAIMTKGGELLCNRPEIVHAAQPHFAIEHISFSPSGGWLIRFIDGKVHHEGFPLVEDLTCGHPGMRQHSKVRGATFGADGSSLVRTEQATVIDKVSSEISNLVKASGSCQMGRATALCPSSYEHYFIELLMPGDLGSTYRYNMPPNVSPELMAALVANQSPRESVSSHPSLRPDETGPYDIPPPAYHLAEGPQTLQQPATMPPPPAPSSQPDTSLRAKFLSKPLRCPKCEKGFAPGDSAHYCETCGDGLCFCVECDTDGSRCPHKAPLVVLGLDPNLPLKKATECYRCWRSIGRGAVMWHCEKCSDPALCQKCWRKGKHCRHLEQGTVSMYAVKKKSSSGDYIEDALEVAGVIFGF